MSHAVSDPSLGLSRKWRGEQESRRVGEQEGGEGRARGSIVLCSGEEIYVGVCFYTSKEVLFLSPKI